MTKMIKKTMANFFQTLFETTTKNQKKHKTSEKKTFLPNAKTYENTITFIKFQKITLMKKSCNRKKINGNSSNKLNN